MRLPSVKSKDRINSKRWKSFRKSKIDVCKAFDGSKLKNAKDGQWTERQRTYMGHRNCESSICSAIVMLELKEMASLVRHWTITSHSMLGKLTLLSFFDKKISYIISMIISYHCFVGFLWLARYMPAPPLQSETFGRLITTHTHWISTHFEPGVPRLLMWNSFRSWCWSVQESGSYTCSFI